MAAASDPAGYSRAGYAGTTLLDALVYEGFYYLTEALDVAGPAAINLADAGQKQQILDGLFGTESDPGLLDKLYDFLAGDSEYGAISNLEMLSGGLEILGDLLLEDAGIDPLLQYCLSEHFWGRLELLWDSGATWTSLEADIELLKTDFKQLCAIDDFDILAELTALLADLADLDVTPAGLNDRPVSRLARYLLQPQDGSNYNPFVDGLASLLCKGLNYYDGVYNPSAAALGDADTLVSIIASLTAYDLRPVQNLLLALSEKRTVSGDLLVWAIMKDLDSLLDEIVGSEELSVSLIQSLFITDAASNRSVVSSLLGIMDFAPVCNGEISMQDVFVELDRLLDGMELQPGSATYNTLIDVLTFVIENSYVD